MVINTNIAARCAIAGGGEGDTGVPPQQPPYIFAISAGVNLAESRLCFLFVFFIVTIFLVQFPSTIWANIIYYTVTGGGGGGSSLSPQHPPYIWAISAGVNLAESRLCFFFVFFIVTIFKFAVYLSNKQRQFNY